MPQDIEEEKVQLAQQLLRLSTNVLKVINNDLWFLMQKTIKGNCLARY